MFVLPDLPWYVELGFNQFCRGKRRRTKPNSEMVYSSLSNSSVFFYEGDFIDSITAS
jgi:hypothetical protein